jgi:translation initiation factor IF-1
MMEIPDKIETVVTIHEVISPSTCHAALPNGKIIFGFMSKKAKAFPLREGGRVLTQMDVADFSRGEMLEAL